jgi:hypothetical protein
MKTPGKMEVKPQLGLDERIPADPGTANRMENFTYDAQTHSWDNYVGFELYTSARGFPTSYWPNAPTDSIYCWQRHSSAQQWLLWEANSVLYWMNVSPGAATVSNILDLNRTVPAANQPGSFYQPFGKYLIISNGSDGPIKWRGQKNRTYSVGWSTRPAAPSGVPPTNVPGDGTPNNFIGGTAYFQLGQNEIGFIDRYKDSTFWGLGSIVVAAENQYTWRVSFVNENGSESPISEASGEVAWVTETITKGANVYANLPCVKVTLPVGPVGTVARRLYRTKNNGDEHFFVQQIQNNVDTFIFDHVQDSALGATAPSENDSITFPAAGARFSATFKNCLWLDGGALNPSRLWHSQPLQLDSYSAFDYFEVGTSSGGDITALFSYYNSLIVFRENAIDLIRGDPVNGFELVPFVTGIGTKSPHSIVVVPNMGIMFLSTDGVYLITGGLDGGAQLNINKISTAIDGIIERMSPDLLPKAVAIYSHKWREAHWYISIDSKPKLNLGIVFHQDSGQWTTRNNNAYRVGCLTTDKDGNIVYGVNQANNLPAQDPNTGIMVISASGNGGYSSVTTGESTVYSEAPALSCKFRSQWMDFGNPYIKKQPKYLYLYMLTTGDQTIPVTMHKDRDWSRSVVGEGKLMQVGDYTLQPTYRDLTAPTQVGNPGVWDATRWQDRTLTCIRYPIVLGSCSEFAFSWDTPKPLVFMGYSVEYAASAIETLKGRT